MKQNVNEYVYYGVTYNDPSQLLFVACEDGTQVKVGSEVINLNEMEMYLYTNGSDLTGVRVEKIYIDNVAGSGTTEVTSCTIDSSGNTLLVLRTRSVCPLNRLVGIV